MDRRIYASGPMGLAEDLAAAGPVAAAPTRAPAAAR